MSMNYFNDLIKDHAVVVELGMVFEEWGYVVIKDKLNSTQNAEETAAIVNPLDFSTFSGLGLSFLVFWVVMVTSEQMLCVGTLRDRFLVAINLLGSLLDQSGCEPCRKASVAALMK